MGLVVNRWELGESTEKGTMDNLTFKVGDCGRMLPEFKDIDLILTDPPYNINWDYPGMKDKIKDYRGWMREIALKCYCSLKEGGIMAFINYPEHNNRLFCDLEGMGPNFVQQLIWHYPTNIGHSKSKYTRSHRTILIYSKGKKWTFNSLKQPYKNPTDKRIKALIENGSNGTNLYDTWEINLCKNVSNSKKNNGVNQLPDKLCDSLILTYSNPGDMVLDPFAGNGTIPYRAVELERVGYGLDVYDYGWDISISRQCKIREINDDTN